MTRRAALVVLSSVTVLWASAVLWHVCVHLFIFVCMHVHEKSNLRLTIYLQLTINN